MILTEEVVLHTENVIWALAKLSEELRFYNDMDGTRPGRVNEVFRKEEESINYTLNRIRNGELVLVEKESLND